MGITKRVLFEVVVELNDNDTYTEEVYNEETDEYDYVPDEDGFLDAIKYHMDNIGNGFWDDADFSLNYFTAKVISQRTL